MLINLHNFPYTHMQIEIIHLTEKRLLFRLEGILSMHTGYFYVMTGRARETVIKM